MRAAAAFRQRGEVSPATDRELLLACQPPLKSSPFWLLEQQCLPAGDVSMLLFSGSDFAPSPG